jgi:hypothetical protein
VIRQIDLLTLKKNKARGRIKCALNVNMQVAVLQQWKEKKKIRMLLGKLQE